MLEAKKPLELIGEFKTLDTIIDFNHPRIELDMGCGKGRFTTELAKRHPEALVMGADIKLDRLRKLNGKAARAGCEKVEALHCLGWELFGVQLPDHSIDRVHILCPDPWPKKAHRRNRMLSSEFMYRVTRKIKKGGSLHLSTDDLPYLEWMKTVTSQLPCLEPDQEVFADIADVQTEFEMNFASQDKPVTHLGFRVLA